MEKDKIVFHRYTTGLKKDILPVILRLDEFTELTDYDEVIDIKERDFPDDKKLYIEIKVFECK